MGSSADDKAKERAEALVGRTIDGRYHIDRVLAAGAMGTVYLGRHLKLKKRVAIKALHPDVEDHPELVMRFEREALAGAQVSHANVACATDFGDLDDGTRYLVMEYVKGANLRDVIDREAPLPAERAVLIARQIAVALGHIHARGIVHRDLKPRNVMLAEDDFVKVVDFGLAKVDNQRISSLPDDEAEEDSRLTARGVIFGTIEYLAPEAAFGMELVDARADLYALGVILYEMLSGKHPFDAKSDAELFAKQRHAPAPPIATRAPGVVVPAELEAAVQRLLHKDFDERYQTAAEAIAALDRAMPSASIAPPEPVEAPPSSVLVASAPPPAPASEPKGPAAQAGGEDAGVEDRAGERADPTRAKKKPKKKQRPAAAEVTSPSEPLAAREREKSGALSYVAVFGALAVLGVGVALLRGGSDHASGPAPSAAATARSERTTSSEAASASARESAEAPVSASASAAAIDTPIPSASASGAPTPSASSAPGADLGAFRARVKDDIRDDGWDDLAEATIAFVASAPQAACDKDAASTLSSALGALSRKKAARGDEAWRAVATAACGPDLLYAFVETGGKAPFASRAAALLRDEAVMQGASPALRVAFVLHDGSCAEKLAALDRAVEEGDGRAVTAMDIQARGCAKNPKAVDVALTRLRARLDTKKK